MALMITYRKPKRKVEDDTLYTILSVSPDATEAEISSAARARLALLHPDRNGGDPRAAHEYAAVVGARDLLLDAERRKRYNEEGLLPVEDSEITKAASEAIVNLLDEVTALDTYRWHIDPIVPVRMEIDERMKKVQKDINKVKKRRKRLGRLLKKMLVREGVTNFLRSRFETTLRGVKDELTGMYVQRRIILRMSSLLDDYTFDADAAPPPPPAPPPQPGYLRAGYGQSDYGQPGYGQNVMRAATAQHPVEIVIPPGMDIETAANAMRQAMMEQGVRPVAGAAYQLSPTGVVVRVR